MLHGFFKSICWGATQVYHQSLNGAIQYLRRFSQDPPSQSNLSFMQFTCCTKCSFTVINCNKASNWIVSKTKGFSVFFWIILSHKVSRYFPTHTHINIHELREPSTYYCTLVDIPLQCSQRLNHNWHIWKSESQNCWWAEQEYCNGGRGGGHGKMSSAFTQDSCSHRLNHNLQMYICLSQNCFWSSLKAENEG